MSAKILAKVCDGSARFGLSETARARDPRPGLIDLGPGFITALRATPSQLNQFGAT